MKLILLDGITGSGKSTTAQFLGWQLGANGIPARWYHEEEPSHPLASRLDIENLQGEAEVEEFIQEAPRLWARFAEQVAIDDRVHVIESILLQDTARVLFQHRVPSERITALINSIVSSLTPLNPVLIYLWQADAEAALRQIWQRRGERWKAWCVQTDANNPYALTIEGDPETRAITFWRDYQEFALELVSLMAVPKLLIESSAGQWEDYRNQMTSFLGLEHKPWLANRSLVDYCGEFRGKLAGRSLYCKLQFVDGILTCDSDFLWPRMRLLPDEGDDLTVESLPFHLSAIRDNLGMIMAFDVVGATRWNGVRLYKTH